MKYIKTLKIWNFQGMKWLFSLALESYLERLKNYQLVSLFSFWFRKLSIGRSDVHLTWDPLINGNSWIGYPGFEPSKKTQTKIQGTVFHKGRISHNGYQDNRLWNCDLPKYFSLSSFSFLYGVYLVTLSCTTAQKFCRLCIQLLHLRPLYTI